VSGHHLVTTRHSQYRLPRNGSRYEILPARRKPLSEVRMKFCKKSIAEIDEKLKLACESRVTKFRPRRSRGLKLARAAYQHCSPSAPEKEPLPRGGSLCLSWTIFRNIVSQQQKTEKVVECPLGVNSTPMTETRIKLTGHKSGNSYFLRILDIRI
jgi:hypothetical protein